MITKIGENEIRRYSIEVTGAKGVYSIGGGTERSIFPYTIGDTIGLRVGEDGVFIIAGGGSEGRIYKGAEESDGMKLHTMKDEGVD